MPLFQQPGVSLMLDRIIERFLFPAEKQDLVDLIFENFGRSYSTRAFSSDRSDASSTRFSQPPSSHRPRSATFDGGSSSTPNADSNSHSQPNFAFYDGIRVRGNDEEDIDGDSSSDDEPAPQETLDDGIRVRAASGELRSPSPEVHEAMEPNDGEYEPEPTAPPEDVHMEEDEFSIGSNSTDGLHGQSRSTENVGAVGPPPEDEPKLNRFPSVSDLKTLEQVDGLSVRECKELLALYRVEFKGLCEKSELLAKVRELWLQRQRAKAGQFHE